MGEGEKEMSKQKVLAQSVWMGMRQDKPYLREAAKKTKAKWTKKEKKN